MIKIAPSVLSADFSNLEKEFDKINKTNADYIHYDVMDGQFVPNISFGYKIMEDMMKLTNIPFDVHLMVYSPLYLFEEYAKRNASIISFHIEAVENPYIYIDEARRLNIKVGIAINPNTPLEKISNYLEDIDQIVVMGVFPGFGGQSLILSTLEKIKQLKEIKDSNNYKYDIEIDGGVNIENSKIIKEAGADILVAGSAIFKTNNYEKTIERLR